MESLPSVILPEGLESAGEYFLSSCRGLTSLTLPEGLTVAGDGFLYGCTGLKELTVPVATPPAVGSNGAFEGVSNTIPVYVPAGSEAAYKTAAVWSYFTDYRPIPTVVASGMCGAEEGGGNITWVLTSDSTLTLRGTGGGGGLRIRHAAVGSIPVGHPHRRGGRRRDAHRELVPQLFAKASPPSPCPTG